MILKKLRMRRAITLLPSVSVYYDIFRLYYYYCYHYYYCYIIYLSNCLSRHHEVNNFEFLYYTLRPILILPLFSFLVSPCVLSIKYSPAALVKELQELIRHQSCPNLGSLPNVSKALHFAYC